MKFRLTLKKVDDSNDTGYKIKRTIFQINNTKTNSVPTR